MKSSVRAHPTPQSPPPVSPLPSSRNLHTPCFLLKTTCLGSTGGGVNGVIDGVIVVEELEEEEHRDRDLGLPYFTSCVRAGCHQKEYWCCSSVCVLNTPTLRLCPLNSTTTSVSKGLSPTLFLSLSFSTTHLPSPTLLSALSFAHFHSRTFSHSVPPLCVPPPHHLFLVFLTLCACVSAMWLTVPLSGLCSMCVTWRRRRCGAPTGLAWASSLRWVLALACTPSSFIW